MAKAMLIVLSLMARAMIFEVDLTSDFLGARNLDEVARGRGEDVNLTLIVLIRHHLEALLAGL
jgi:hypothetical protein